MGEALIREFDEDAQWHGWERDQGTGAWTKRAEKARAKSKAALTNYVLDMEATLAMIQLHEGK